MSEDVAGEPYSVYVLMRGGPIMRCQMDAAEAEGFVASLEASPPDRLVRLPNRLSRLSAYRAGDVVGVRVTWGPSSDETKLVDRLTSTLDTAGVTADDARRNAVESLVAMNADMASDVAAWLEQALAHRN